MSPHTATTAAAVRPLLADRWAPSAYNAQPWRFLVGRRGDTTYLRILDALIPFNQEWAQTGSLLVAVVAEERVENPEPQPRRRPATRRPPLTGLCAGPRSSLTRHDRR
ncbi:nitroreductase family protein [Streptomyces albogriseolus]|uniref:Nitroreductase n=1 Tax=Streptomyces albogriseolus TaxID=1887 RepID=A0ACC6UW89_STRAO